MLRIESLRQSCVALYHIRRRSMVYRWEQTAADVPFDQARRRALQSSELSPSYALELLEFTVCRWEMVCRYYRGGLLAVVCSPEQKHQLLEVVRSLTADEIIRLGGGLSAHSTIDLRPHESEVSTANRIRTWREVTAFLNESFEFLCHSRGRRERARFSKTMIADGQLDLAIDPSTGLFFSTGPGQPITVQEGQLLEQRFREFVASLDIPRISGLDSSHISSPPWRWTLRGTDPDQIDTQPERGRK